MMKAVRIHAIGGPHVMKYETCPKPKVEPGKVLIKNTLIGVNYIDVYHRNGIYKVDFPFIPGRDGAGHIEEITQEDSNTLGINIGDRVAYGPFNSGSYAEYTTASTNNIIKIPHHVSDAQAVGGMVQGLTAHYLTKGSYFVKKGDVVLIQAIAGGLGLWLCQVSKHLGATVIGTASNPTKAAKAKEAGADHVILYTSQDIVNETMKFTDGKGVNVVYDSVGKETWAASLKCLRKRGSLVLCGNASGKVPPIDPLTLTQQGSITLIRPTLFDYIENRSEFLERMQDVFHWLQKGMVQVHVTTMKLQDAALAHEKLEGKEDDSDLTFKHAKQQEN